MNTLLEKGIIGLGYLKLIYFILFTVGYNMYLNTTNLNLQEILFNHHYVTIDNSAFVKTQAFSPINND